MNPKTEAFTIEFGRYKIRISKKHIEETTLRKIIKYSALAGAIIFMILAVLAAVGVIK